MLNMKKYRAMYQKHKYASESLFITDGSLVFAFNFYNKQWLDFSLSTISLDYVEDLECTFSTKSIKYFKKYIKIMTDAPLPKGFFGDI
jgi:hypothetical protein